MNPSGTVLSANGNVLQQPWPSVDPEYLQTPDTLQVSVLVRLAQKLLPQTPQIIILYVRHNVSTFQTV